MPNSHPFVERVNELLETLDTDPSAKNGVELANEILKLVGMLDVKSAEEVFESGLELPNAERYDRWFQPHPIFKSDRACFELAESELLQAKFYWLQKHTRQIIAGGVHFTPNFEDEDFTHNERYKVGIDFFLSPNGKSLQVVLSNRGNLRVVELNKRLNSTQVDIFTKWDGAGSLSTQEALHTTLWESFKLKSVNQKFYDGVANSFNELLQHLKSIDKDDEEAKLFASRLFGRLLFCWFLRKKGIIDETAGYFDAQGLDATSYYKSSLERLFFLTLNTPLDERDELQKQHQQQLIHLPSDSNQPSLFKTDQTTPYLNGGLFEPHDNDWFNDEGLTFPEGFFTNLYDHFEEFNFTTDESSPEYEQIAIDPEMLGRVFESLLATQIDETGQQARKAKGAFYTPREIVSYMCKESLRNYLYSSLNNDERYKKAIDDLLDTSDREWAGAGTNSKRDSVPKEYRTQVIDALDNVTVLDPACGSGAFPMGMLQLCLRTYERLESRFDPYKTKLQIIEKNIFGVDIEPMAVEIARLRAWLSLIVDEIPGVSVDTLPNLDFKFVCANSLLPLADSDSLNLWQDEDHDKKLTEIRKQYFNAKTKKSKDRLKQSYLLIINQADISQNKRIHQLNSFEPFKNSRPASFYDNEQMFGVNDGFNIIIGNPPYVSTKGTGVAQKKDFLKIYGFADDLYSHFYFRGLELCSNNGVLAFITSKTFWVIQTKKNVRELLLNQNLISIFDTANPFESVMVDTCVIVAQKNTAQLKNVDFLINHRDYNNPEVLTVPKLIYENAVNKVIFNPSTSNLAIYDRYNTKVSELMDTYWPLINTSKNITKNITRLNDYRRELKPGTVTLLGLISDGGVGLQTGNNGKYVGVLSTTKEAKRIRITRVEKFWDFASKNKLFQYGSTKESASKYLSNLEENNLRILFDDLKNKYGHNIFGKGYIFRIVAPSEISDINTLSEIEKKQGILGTRTFVPYDKGDKDGNKWYTRTPFYIDWSRANVEFLDNNSGKNGENMPVFRNPQFYFKEGFSWNLINGTRTTNELKFTITAPSVNDMASNKLTTLVDRISNKYIASVCNSKLINIYTENFINFTLNFPHNSTRQIPIIVPSQDQLNDFEDIYDRAFIIKADFFDGKLSQKDAEGKLKSIQKELDDAVYELYNIAPIVITNNEGPLSGE